MVGLAPRPLGAGFALPAAMPRRIRPRPPGRARYVFESFLDGGAHCGRALDRVAASASRDGGRGRALGAGPLDQDTRLVPAADPRSMGVLRVATSAGHRRDGDVGVHRDRPVFWLGWPWLWYDPVGRMQAYWGTGVARPTIRVQYFGQVIADRDVPWHYPWFYFAVTVPLGLQLLGGVGIVRAWKNRRAHDAFPLLLAATIAAFLILFSTRVPVYDGERLFLHVFPAWSLLIGLGFHTLWNHFQTVSVRSRFRVILSGFLLTQGYGTVLLHPFGLSFYNGLTGGLAGADRLGLELTYWNDAVDSVLLDRLAREGQPGSTASLVPTLYPQQGILTTNRALAKAGIILQDQQEGTRSEWVVLSRRTAYWRPEITERLERGEGERIAVRSRQGTWLSALWHFPPALSRPVERRSWVVEAHPNASNTHPRTQRPKNSRYASETCGSSPLPSSRRLADS